jgi:hypothetical protein
MYKHCKKGDSGTFVRLGGEKERHDSAITCREVGRVVSQLTTGGNLNLRRSSSRQPTQTDTTMSTPRTLILAVLVGGTAG